ncbi:phosphoserine phosphatase SerB [Kocuria coralli]|uniref:phosphoserine phosphatase n=1 Tax=Kocuria coralli TaxID=1461025 RepID=A0A5J5L018_9MICC|nr:phosphoserine phosphatase SerB [Kocuria coralli]KAA9394960.1 phosphoserine phosphatase SerB [Kocuria coralli]
MTDELAVIALSRTPEPEDADRILAELEDAGATVEQYGRVRVTATASSGGEDSEATGYSAMTVRVAGGDLEALRKRMRPDPEGFRWHSVDVNVIPQALFDPDAKKLLVVDVDSTLIQQEVIDLLAGHVGRQEEVAAVTERAMRGEIDFARSLQERVAVLEGVPESVLDEVISQVRLSIGARVLVETFHRAGHTVGAVSGGFNQILAPLAEKLGLDHYRANDLEIVDGHLTGRVLGEVVDADVKERMLKQWAAEDGVSPEQVIAVGDGANDAKMLSSAAVGISFNGKPLLRQSADAQINMPNLDSVRFFADL